MCPSLSCLSGFLYPEEDADPPVFDDPAHNTTLSFTFPKKKATKVMAGNIPCHHIFVGINEQICRDKSQTDQSDLKKPPSTQ